MPVLPRLEQYYHEAKANKWYRYFAVFCRIVLALGFIPSGVVKVVGERFTGLAANHPLGHYFEALHLTGYYYTFVGVAQLVAAALLLIPRTALLGALTYFPIILNITILAYATRFEGTRITTLMLLANLYLLLWDYDRLKHILPFKQPKKDTSTTETATTLASANKFPVVFFGGVFATAALVIVVNHFLYNIRPGNYILECTNGCAGHSSPKACEVFCDCIHNQGKPLHECLEAYEKIKAGERRQ